MCGRFVVGEPDPALWADWLGVPVDGPWPEARWNLAPTQEIAILRDGDEGRRLDRARWGLVPHWWRKPLAEMKASTFNARSEDAATKPMFSDAWKRGRCLVPAIGYYEWTGRKGAKQPWFVTFRTNAPGICFAGLWAFARPEDRPEGLLSVTILTCDAGRATAHLHPRCPVILEEGDWARWLEPGSEAADLMRAPEDGRVEAWPVDPAVGRVANEGPELVARQGLGI